MSAPAGAATTTNASSASASRRMPGGSAAARAPLPRLGVRSAAPAGACGRLRLGDDHGPRRLVGYRLALGHDDRAGRLRRGRRGLRNRLGDRLDRGGCPLLTLYGADAGLEL